MNVPWANCMMRLRHEEIAIDSRKKAGPASAGSLSRPPVGGRASRIEDPA